MADYRALYRKWRPFDFDDVCGQAAVTDILKYEVANNKISHAYLFCGSRGTGKTSCAKILAKAVNCENPKGGNPCNECEACKSIDRGIATDVIEMDAASNNGVDNVRDLKDEISFTPALLKYRVYIIDEVHMMSSAAFNALLKTLEEPPTYVVFILATTELHKLPTTIISRCQRFDFRRMTSEVIISRLMHIAKHEGIDLGEDGARVIARASQGGMRDAVSLLELCAGMRRHIDENLVSETVGTGNRENAYGMLEALADADHERMYGIVQDIVTSSADLSVFWQDLIDAYRDMMVVRTARDAKSYLDLTDTEFERLSAVASRFSMTKMFYHVSLLEEALSDMQRAIHSKRSVAEITLTRMCDAKLSASPEALALRVEELERQISRMELGVLPSTASTVSESEDRRAAPQALKKEAPARATEPKRTESRERPYEKTGALIERIGEIKYSLASPLQNAAFTVSENHVYTVYLDAFFANRLISNTADLSIIKGVIAQLEGLTPDAVTLVPKAKGAAGPRDPISELDSIFGN